MTVFEFDTLKKDDDPLLGVAAKTVPPDGRLGNSFSFAVPAPLPFPFSRSRSLRPMLNDSFDVFLATVRAA